jgi:16S rRNA processing protein RimM
MNKEDLIKLGFVAHPHGIKGEAELRLYNQDDSILEDAMTVFLYPSSPESNISPHGEEWRIEKIRFGNKVICQFQDVKDRTMLEAMIPFEIYIEREMFPETQDNEVYLVDLIDMDVVNEEGAVIGKLESFSDNGMQYLFELRIGPQGEKVTLPYVENFFPKIDIEKRQITVILPEYTE